MIETEAKNRIDNIALLLIGLIKDVRLEYQTGLHSPELSRKIIAMEDMLGVLRLREEKR